MKDAGWLALLELITGVAGFAIIWTEKGFLLALAIFLLTWSHQIHQRINK